MTRFVTAGDGIRLAYDDSGVGRPIVLLHGGGQTRYAWSRTARVLADRGYRAITVDARGHGESDWADRYGLALFASDLTCLISRLGLDAPAIVGASLGGLTAIAALGGEHPPSASALVLVDIALRNRPGGVRQIRDFMHAHGDGFASVDEAADAVARYMTDRPRPKDVSGLRRNLRERDGRLFWHWDPKVMDGARHADDGAEMTLDALDSAAARLTLPTLMIRGEHSAVVDGDAVAHLRTVIPHIEIAEVKGAGHMVAGDANSPFTTAIGAFLDRHRPAG